MLKGHLLIEELINITIDGLLPNPQALKAAQLDCFQRIRLLMALVPDHGFHYTFEAFEKLNSIRNKYGHILEPPQIEDRLLAFVQMVEVKMRKDSKPQNESNAERLSSAICFLCGQLQIVSLLYIAMSKLTSLTRVSDGEFDKTSTRWADIQVNLPDALQVNP